MGLHKAFNKLPFATQFAIMFVAFAATTVATRQLYNLYSATLSSRYRDKSALYGRELKPGEPPSWP